MYSALSPSPTDTQHESLPAASHNLVMTDLARRLWQARRSGAVVQLDDIVQPKNGQGAYAIQHEFAALCGEPACGFKVGSTSLEAQRLLGTDEPGSGLLLASYVHESPEIGRAHV